MEQDHAALSFVRSIGRLVSQDGVVTARLELHPEAPGTELKLERSEEDGRAEMITSAHDKISFKDNILILHPPCLSMHLA